MAEIVDTRGLSCPQPVLMTLTKIKEMSSGEIEVIVDNQVSRENVNRAATNAGWELTEEREESEDFRLVFKR
ncbi:MAG: sulfurtransferase TusA family protein [Desulfomonilaceae bacterium]|nr:sulfurtransferase TusA family protein [Desulfomonilaceae bacterium]